MSIPKLLRSFLDHVQRRLDAVRAADAPRANREHLKAAATASELRSTREGRTALEDLLSHFNANVRLSAAEQVIQWAPDAAVPVIGHLLADGLTHITSGDERLDIRVRAKDILYIHFGIRTFDRNDLIEPLRRYGIDLEFREHDRWR